MATRQASSFLFSLFVLASRISTADSQAIELSNLGCDDDVKAQAKCGAGGVFNSGEGALSGTFVCRKQFSLFFAPGFQTACAPTVLNQVIGLADDQCGCCNGVCPPACTCVCDVAEDKVLIKTMSFFRGETTECVSRGKASRKVSDGTNNYQCVEDDACPAIETPDEGTDESDEVDEVGTKRFAPGE